MFSPGDRMDNPPRPASPRRHRQDKKLSAAKNPGLVRRAEQRDLSRRRRVHALRKAAATVPDDSDDDGAALLRAPPRGDDDWAVVAAAPPSPERAAVSRLRRLLGSVRALVRAFFA
jgi:hypothetical protein